MNIPNILTVIRLILIPIFLMNFFSSHEYGIHISTLVFVLAGLTDMLDGYIARKYNLITRLGIILDPLADKLMLITVLISITIRYGIPVWVLAVVALKELLMILGAITLYNLHDVVVPANNFGKLATVMSYAAILGITLKLPYGRLFLNVFILFTILAFTVYLNSFISIKKQHSIDLIKK